MTKYISGVVQFYFDVKVEVPYGECESPASLEERLKNAAMTAPASSIIGKGVVVIEEVDVNEQ